MPAPMWKAFSDTTHLVDDDDKAVCGANVDASKSVEFGPARTSFLRNCVDCVGAYAKLVERQRTMARAVPRAARAAR